MHFRLFVSIIYRQFIAHVKRIKIDQVTPEDFIEYIALHYD